jgi:hypothetical protein
MCISTASGVVVVIALPFGCLNGEDKTAGIHSVFLSPCVGLTVGDFIYTTGRKRVSRRIIHC